MSTAETVYKAVPCTNPGSCLVRWAVEGPGGFRQRGLSKRDAETVARAMNSAHEAALRMQPGKEPADGA